MIETIAGRTRPDRSGAGSDQTGQLEAANAAGTTSASAEIIAFRPRPVASGATSGTPAAGRTPGRTLGPQPARTPAPLSPAPLGAGPSADQQRLARAVMSLDTAMEDQRAAMAQWRTALAALRTTAAALGNSMDLYRANLASLSDGVSSLHTEAAALHQLVDNPVTVKRPAAD